MQNALISMDIEQNNQEQKVTVDSIMQQQHQILNELIIVNMADFLSMDLPERGFLLEPIIPTQGIVILYAPRGIGKTFTALSMSLAVAGGLSVRIIGRQVSLARYYMLMVKCPQLQCKKG